MEKLNKGAFVLIEAMDHCKNGRVGKVVDGPGEFLGTYKVNFQEDRDDYDYGFQPHELTELVPR